MRAKKYSVIMFLLIIIGSSFGGYLLNDYLNTPRNVPEIHWEVYSPGSYRNNLTAETVIQGINAENEIISTSVNLSSEIKIDESYFDLNILRRTQVLKFYGTALYTINLGNLSESDIYISEDFIRVSISKPELYSLNLNAEKTIVDRVNRGLLSFGAIRIRPEDYRYMQILALSQMREQLRGEDIRFLTETNAKKAADELFQSVLAVLRAGDDETAVPQIVEIVFN